MALDMTTARRRLRRGAAALLFGAFGLAACTLQSTKSLVAERTPGPTAGPVAPVATGDVIGQGSTRVALLVPLSAGGAAGAAGRSLRNAAELAYRDSGNPNIQILVRDTGGTPQGASAAATQAIQEGAALILGPLTAPDVAAVSGVARGANINVIAFSTDQNVAAPGVYLLSFMVDSEVERVVTHAARAGKRAFAAIVPDTAYGALASATFQQAVARNGGRIVALEQVGADTSGRQAAVQRIAGLVKSGAVDTLFVPESGSGLKSALDVLAANGVDGRSVKVIGTGVWNEPATLADSRLEGGWFAGPNPSGFQVFAGRYRQAFGSEPLRIAPLAYDAAHLAIALGQQGPGGYSSGAILNPNGFEGVDGVFRFRPEGPAQRGLAVLEVRGGAAVPVSPPLDTFQQVAGQ